MPELIFIFLIALLIFGPAQLPKLGRQLGKALGEFKRASNDFKNQLEDEVHKLELEQLKEEARKSVSLEPPEGTVAKESVDYSRLSHQAAWEHGEHKIMPPKPAGESPASTQTGESPASTPAGESPASTPAGESPASTRVTGERAS